MRESVLRPGARAYYEIASDIERADIVRRVEWLVHHPYPDGITTIAVPDLPNFAVFDDGVWQMLYELPDAATVAIHSIAHALDLHQG